MKIEEGKIRNDNRGGQGIGLELKVIKTLQRIGIKSGQSVLDFGCGSGTYTIPVAKIVGKQGKVYALEKDKNALDDLMNKAELGHLRNIERMATSGELTIELPDKSVDITLLFDVFHRYYVPQMSDRKRLLDEICRITKTEGFVVAPESAHAIKAVIDFAQMCKKNSEKKIIVFSNSGHGYFDLSAYDAYLNKDLQDYSF